MFGRKVIYTDEEITLATVENVLKKALETHDRNRRDIQTLYDVYRGKHDILDRIKEVRPEINNKIVVNYPYRIVRFKTGYDLGEPIQYVSRNSNSKGVMLLNSYMDAKNKRTHDISLVEWVHIAGVGYRYVMDMDDPIPFTIATLDPRYTFCVYDRKIEHNQKFCCTFFEDDEGRATYYLYTDTDQYTIYPDGKIETAPYIGIRQPITEYYFNNAHLGAFEPVLELCNAIDKLASNRLDGVEQFVQSLMMFKGVNIDSEDYLKLRDEGAILVPPDGDIRYLVSEMDQTQTQSLLDNMYQQLLEIVGMPNRSGGYSTSDTGIAVIYRDGWSDAEAYAKNDEMMFKRSENQFLKAVIYLCNNLADMDLDPADIEINFTRRNYENIAQKSEVLLGMLGSDKIHPKLAFIHSGMFPDPETAYKMSEEYYEDTVNRTVDELENPTEEVDV